MSKGSEADVSSRETAPEFDHESHRAEPLSVVNAIAAEAARTRDLPALLKLAVERLIALTGTEAGAALLIDEDSGTMYLAAEHNLPDAAKTLLAQQQPLVGQGIPGAAAEQCRLLIVENSWQDEREFPPFREMGIKTHICIPLTVRGRSLGVLGLVARELCTFEANERALFTALGEQLGIAIENARLSEQQAKLTERAQVLNELMRVAVSSMNTPEAIDGIAGQVRRLLGFDRFSISIHPEGSDWVETYAGSGEEAPSSERHRTGLFDTPFGEAIRTGEPIIRGNVIEEGVYPIEQEVVAESGYLSLMSVPLKSRGRIIGCLNFRSRDADSFTEDDLVAAQEIADHLAVVVEHTILHERAEEGAVALRRLNKQLEGANRHKSEFLASLSHELRTPLNAILGGSELLGEGLFGELNEKQAEYIHDINESGQHLLSLINDVLDLSKVEAGHIELQPDHFDLRSLMKSSVTIVRERASRKSIDLRIEPPDEEVIVEADERKVKQVVYNLLSNAVKFTPDGGTVTFSGKADGDEFVLSVQDTGPGVPEDYCEKIFDEFVQIPGTTEGTGLGLALCKRFVELHGGRVWLASTSGVGSTFHVAIPLCR